MHSKAISAVRRKTITRLNGQPDATARCRSAVGALLAHRRKSTAPRSANESL
ncbi:hypothetical protein [Streptomyces antarcticus]|uniref:hypothetical protein n=1 Tax=Streptomyces antarcticus TaxID=2996458 RepID=UPI002270F9B8|nr:MULTISPECIES: hypothetical protein [unclassified Streptomyces]MCY0945008.1 hypothetical protein [Streptomyces sp. H34-AA3]MCY0951535.1 hypothetical protein [Streptomyces sp. H27-S2]MCZ4082181.1 hypothetical protein [Streptomyces sp. H34-S5]